MKLFPRSRARIHYAFVSSPCIEVADPTPEGSRIVEALRARGFYVLERSFDGLDTEREAALVMVAIDVAGGATALERIAKSGSTVPVIAIGAASDASSYPEPDASLPRPVSVERLVRKVETLLAPPETRLKSIVRATPESERAGTTPSQRPRERPTVPPPPPEPAPRPRREPTIDLSAPREPTMELRSDLSIDLRTLAPPPERTPTSVRPSEPPPTTDGSLSSSPAIRLSPKLETLLETADRRLFPAEPPLDFRFVAGDESAADLVPEGLLDDVALDWHDEDPLNAYTQFVSADASMAPAAESDSQSSKATPLPKLPTPPPKPARRPTSRPPPPNDAPELTGDPSTLFGRKAMPTGAPESGEAPIVEWLRFLWRKSADPRAHRLEIHSGERQLALVLSRGDVVEIAGPIALYAVEQLRHEGRHLVTPVDEQGARAALDREMSALGASRLELERRLRRARERLVHELAISPQTSYLATPLDPKVVSRTPLLSGTLREVLLEGARRLVSADMVIATFGGAGARLTPLSPEFAATARLEPELHAMLEEAEGRPLREVLDAAPPSEGLPGAVFLMLATGALKITEPVADSESPIRSHGAVVLDELHRTAREGNYFAILGAPASATSRELEQAYRDRRRLVEGAHTGSSERLETARAAALEALDEAWFALEDERTRSRYREALGLS
jgi:hypothetical protein